MNSLYARVDMLSSNSLTEKELPVGERDVTPVCQSGCCPAVQGLSPLPLCLPRGR